MIKSFKDLEVYNLSYELAMDIFRLTRSFPKEEVYSLTSQVVRSSRSVAANLSEGWAKRNYENVFKQQMINSLGSNSETQTWVDFAKDCGYISEEDHDEFSIKIDELGRKLTRLYQNWKSKPSNIKPLTSNL